MTAQDRPTSKLGAASEANPAYRQIPSVNQLVELPSFDRWRQRVPRSLIVECARSAIEEHRATIVNDNGEVPRATFGDLVHRIESKLNASQHPPLSGVINATGIIVHTGLGRAPLAESVVQALGDVARCYAPVELDLDTGDRWSRPEIVRQLLCDLTGAESATVVNNNAAALLIVLSTLAKGCHVIVSRGELIEIGGSFRLPEVMETGGSILREVGTTNKTHLADYERAIDDNTGAVLKVHTSNFRIEGFTESVPIEALVALGQRFDVPVLHDIGSGSLTDVTTPRLTDEPDARSSIRAGADLVLFSGDKLLGGPQAGVIVGKKRWIERIEKNPIMRAMRVDKLTLAALGATLQLHRDPQRAAQTVPVLIMLTTDIAVLEHRARQLVQRLQPLDEIDEVDVQRVSAYVGGGSVPTQAVPSAAVQLRVSNVSEHEIAKRLRLGSPAVVPRTQAGAVWFDLRTVFPEQDDTLFNAIRTAVGEC